MSIKNSIFIKAPLEKVYSYTVNPANWIHFYAGLSKIEIENGNGEVGTVVNGQYSIAGIHFSVKTEVTHSEITPEGAKWVGKFSGSINGKQTSTYLPKDNGTELTFDIENDLPESLLGRLANNLIIEKMLANSDKHTLENIKAICEAE